MREETASRNGDRVSPEPQPRSAQLGRWGWKVICSLGTGTSGLLQMAVLHDPKAGDRRLRAQSAGETGSARLPTSMTRR